MYIILKKHNKKEFDNIVLTSINKYIELICNVSKNIEELASHSRLEYNEEVKT